MLKIHLIIDYEYSKDFSKYNLNFHVKIKYYNTKYRRFVSKAFSV